MCPLSSCLPSSHTQCPPGWAVTSDLGPVGCAFHSAAEGSSQAIRPGHSLALSPASPAHLTQTKLKPCSQPCRFRLPPTAPASSPDALLPPSAPGLQTLTVPCTREHKAPSGPVRPPCPPPPGLFPQTSSQPLPFFLQVYS